MTEYKVTKKNHSKKSEWFYTKYTKTIMYYLNLSTDFTRSSSFFIALFAMTSSKTTIIGSTNPIPFSETNVSPDKFSD